MRGIAITCMSIFLGALLAGVDVFSGVAIIAVGGIAGVVITWFELS